LPRQRATLSSRSAPEMKAAARTYRYIERRAIRRAAQAPEWASPTRKDEANEATAKSNTRQQTQPRRHRENAHRHTQTNIEKKAGTRHTTNQGAQQNEPHSTNQRASWNDRNRRLRKPHNQQSGAKSEKPQEYNMPTDIGTKGRAEDTCRHAHRLEASRAAAANPGARAAPTAKEAAAGWMTEMSPTTSRRGNIGLQRGTRPTAWAPKGEEAEAKPRAKYTRGETKHRQTRVTRDTPKPDKLQTHPHMSAKATVKQATADNIRPPRPRDKRGRATGPGQTP
jgi:hypothetical protein